jgi:hypothetical protein
MSGEVFQTRTPGVPSLHSLGRRISMIRPVGGLAAWCAACNLPAGRGVEIVDVANKRGYYHPPKHGIAAAFLGALPLGLAAAAASGVGLIAVAEAYPGADIVFAGIAFAMPWVLAVLAIATAAIFCRARHIRRHGIALTVAGLCALASVVIGWLARAALATGIAPRSPASPDAAAELAQGLATSAWTTATTTVSTPVLAGFAALEALAIMGLGLWLVRRWLSAPVCPRCRVWCQTEKRTWAAAADPGDAERTVRARNWVALRPHHRSGTMPRRQVRLDLASCRRCGGVRSVDAFWIYPLVGAVRLVSNMLLSEDEVRTVKNLPSSPRTQRT